MAKTTMRLLGATGYQVSDIGFGALEIGRDWAPDVNANCAHCTPEEASHTLNGLLDAGVNFIDTAPAYWNSEEFIGQSISHRRNEFILATKVGEHCDREGSFYDYSYEATLRFIDQSLKRLRTDRIDLIQIHSAKMDVLEKGDTFAAMSAARDAGKVLHIGMTGGVDECIRAMEIGGYETVQFPYNLLNAAAEDRLLPLAREKNAGVIIMRGLAGGKLTPKYTQLQDEALRDGIAGFLQFSDHPDQEEALVELALGYILAAPEVSSVIVGTRRLDAVTRNISLAASGLKAMTPEKRERVREYSKALTARAW